MREAREEMLQSLNENNLEKMRKAAGGAKQTLKMKDGSIGMDSFTASAIMQIYDKINDKNKKTMENLLKDGKKADIVKLMKFAMSKVNAEYVPEDMTVTASTDGGISQRDLDYVQKQLRKLGIRDAVVDQNEMDSNKIDVKTRMSDDKVKKAFDKSKITVNYEHVDLDEEKGPRQLVNPNKEIMVIKKNKVIVIDKKDKDKYMKKGWTLAEEVELDEKFEYVLVDKDNKVIGVFGTKQRAKDFEPKAKKQPALKNRLPLRIQPIKPKSKKVGDTVIGIGEEVETANTYEEK